MTFAVLVVRFIVHPLQRKPAGEQVALYLEENEPSIEGAVMAAVESAHEPASPQSIRSLVQRMALDRARAVDDGRRVDAANLRRAGAALVAAVVVFAVVVLSADRLRHGMRTLLVPWESAEAANPFRLDVKPGDATIAKGGSVLVTAQAFGFSAAGAGENSPGATTHGITLTRLPSTEKVRSVPKSVVIWAFFARAIRSPTARQVTLT